MKQLNKTWLSLIGVLLFISLLALGIHQLPASKAEALPLKEAIDLLAEEQHFKGSIAIIDDQQVTSVLHYGYANKEKNKLNSSSTLYPIASIQKMMTGIMIGQLIEEGKLAYDTSLDHFLPDVPHSETVTIADLLNHTSGYMLPEIPSEDVLESEEDQVAYAIAHTEMLTDNSFAYSNGNYVFLADIIRQLDATSYAESFNKRIREKANITQLTLWSPEMDMTNIPLEYYFDKEDYQQGETLNSPELMSTLLGAGNAYASINALASFELALETNQLIKPTTYDLLFHSDVDTLSSYRSGAFVGSDRRSAYGGLSGYGSVIIGDEEGQHVLVSLNNQPPYNGIGDFTEDIFILSQ